MTFLRGSIVKPHNVTSVNDATTSLPRRDGFDLIGIQRSDATRNGTLTNPIPSDSKETITLDRKLKIFSEGYPVQTIPLNYIKDGKIRIGALPARQKDTDYATIYFMASKEYQSVKLAYEKINKQDLGLARAFYDKKKQIIFVELPEKNGKSPVNDSNFKISSEEYRSIREVEHYAYEQSKGSNDFKALRLAKSARRFGIAGDNDLTREQTILVETIHHLLSLSKDGSKHKALLTAFDYIKKKYQNEEAEYIILKLMEKNPDKEDIILGYYKDSTIVNQDTPSANLSKSQLAKDRCMIALAQERIVRADSIGLGNPLLVSIDTQAQLLTESMNNGILLQDLIIHNPLGTKLKVISGKNKITKQGYHGIEFQTYSDNFNFHTSPYKENSEYFDIYTRFHSRTSQEFIELPSFRIELIDRSGNIYQLTNITAGRSLPSSSPNRDNLWVDVSKSIPLLMKGDIKLGEAWKEFGLMATTDGRVFSKSDREVVRDREGKEKKISFTTSANGVRLPYKFNEMIRKSWHIEHIPLGMDLSNRYN